MRCGRRFSCIPYRRRFKRFTDSVINVIYSASVQHGVTKNRTSPGFPWMYSTFLLIQLKHRGFDVCRMCVGADWSHNRHYRPVFGASAVFRDNPYSKVQHVPRLYCLAFSYNTRYYLPSERKLFVLDWRAQILLFATTDVYQCGWQFLRNWKHNNFLPPCCEALVWSNLSILRPMSPTLMNSAYIFKRLAEKFDGLSRIAQYSDHETPSRFSHW